MWWYQCTNRARRQKLDAVLDQWPDDRHLLYCDEGLVGVATAFGTLPSGKWAI